MELNIEISQRELSFKVDNQLGSSLNELIETASDKTIGSIRISGESKSYTFLRQVALFVNLITKLGDCRVELKSKCFSICENTIAPIYK
jgi:hypothetical protein